MSRQLNSTLIRTLHALELALLDHDRRLAELECEDPEAAEAILFAIEATASALRKTRETKRNELHAAGFGIAAATNH
ncbi:MAG: hypothetical protein AB7I48_26455 [Planctomycetaceae bacterium]